jgi:hypothetical protein
VQRVLVKRLKPFVPARLRRGLREIQALEWVPYTDWGDYLWARHRFHAVHKRRPRRDSWLYNDVLFRLRITELNLPERIRVTDKEHVKDFVRERVGERYNVPTIAVLRSAEEAAAFDYPTECVIKPTHMSGEKVFNRAGHAIDRSEIARWFGANYYRAVRETNYRTLTPKVIVEPYVFGAVYPAFAREYKLHCIEGRPRLIRAIQRGEREIYSTHDLAWRWYPFGIIYPADGELPRPDTLDEMVALAERLSAGFSWMRVDLYSDGKDVRVGELTNCTGGGITLTFGEEIGSRVLWPERWQ